MQNFQIIDYSILGFGGLFCIIWAFSLFLLTPFKVNIAAVFFVGTSGFRLIWEAFTLSGIVFDNPDIYAYPIPFLYLIGPSILLYYERLGGKEEWNLNLYHFIPCILAFIPIVNWIKLDAKIELINFILNSKFNFPEFLFVLWVIGPKISILIYSMVITLGKSGEGVRAIRSLPEEIKLFSIILLTYIWIMIVTDIFW